jgi:hypothetical protein
MLKRKPQRVRPDLPPVPANMRHLAVNAAGYPVPWFVEWVNGEPDFRVTSGEKIWLAIQRNTCWMCGKPLGKQMAFVIGPMCAINRTNPEPPSHPACAIFAAMACPFLTRPAAERRDDNMPANSEEPAGISIRRNPGACGVWIVEGYKLFKDGRGGTLIDLGEPLAVHWFAEGRAATRAEVAASIRSGYPILEKAARLGGGIEHVIELNKAVKQVLPWLPADDVMDALEDLRG